MICELELALTDHFSVWPLFNSYIKSLVCHMVSRFSDTQHNPASCPYIGARSTVNISVIMWVSRPYSDIEMHTALNSRSLKFNFGFDDLSIGLSLPNAEIFLNLLNLYNYK